MPTIHSMSLPLPKNWQDFEDLVLAALGLRWKSTTLQKNGRPGQKQHGIDIYGPDDIGRRVGIQCKKYKGALDIKVVLAEIANAEKFKGRLSALFIATTADHDSKLQQEVRQLSDKRVATDQFAVSLLFWDDIIASLALNPAVVKSFYPQIQLSAHTEIDRDRLLAALEVGYYGPYLWEYVELTFGEVGQMANADPDTVDVILRIIEQRAAQLLAPADANVILESIKHLRSGCYTTKKRSRTTWQIVKEHAKRVADRVKSASSLLPIVEGNMLETGVTLGHIYHHVDDRPDKHLRDDLRRRLSSLLPETSQPTVDQKFVDAAKVKSGYAWAPRIYTCLDREIRWAAF